MLDISAFGTSLEFKTFLFNCKFELLAPEYLKLRKYNKISNKEVRNLKKIL